MSSEIIGKNVKSFIIKSIQCIVEARLGVFPIVTVGKPNGNEWFNIALNEFQDVNEQTKKCLESLIRNSSLPINIFLIQNNYNICCEISLKTNDNEQMNLEYWIIKNRTLKNHIVTDKNLDRESSTRLFQSYNQMSILIKSIICLSRATPAYKISRDGQSAESYIVCYRVYKFDSSVEQVLKDSNINDEEMKHYSNEIKIGSVSTDHNIIELSLIYRTNLRSSQKDKVNIKEEETKNLTMRINHFNDDTSNEMKKEKSFIPAFALDSLNIQNSENIPDLPEETFQHLLPANHQNEISTITKEEKILESSINSKTSDPIKISKPRKNFFLDDDFLNFKTNTSPACSSLGSFVIVDMKTPFAPSDQNDLGSFFNGPSPTFHENNLAEELEDITTQLEQIETSCEEWSNFVDSITSKKEDDA